MDSKEKRAYPRVETCNLIFFVALNEKGKIVCRNLGNAVNISQSGVLMETPCPVSGPDIVLITLDLECRWIQTKGKVAYCVKTAAGKFNVGISFQGSCDQNVKFAMSLIRAYHSRKKNGSG